MQIIDCKGFQLGRFKIPSFNLNRGEIVNLQIFSGGHFWELEEKLIQIFTGIIQHENVKISGRIEFAEHIRETGILSKLFPLTVGKYLKKNARPTEMSLSIFPDDRLKPETPISHLAGNPRKFLSIYSVLSRCDGVIFDLVGNDPSGAEKLFEIVKDFVDHKNGYAILMNNFDDFQEDSTKNIQLEVIE